MAVIDCGLNINKSNPHICRNLGPVVQKKIPFHKDKIF